MQEHTYMTIPSVHSRLRSRLLLPAGIDEVRAALEQRVAEAPLDMAARVSLGELNLSVCLAAAAGAAEHAQSPAPDLLRARHVVPDLGAIAARPKVSRSRT
jgi:hypothetical protein